MRGGGNLAGWATVYWDMDGTPKSVTMDNVYEVTLSAPEGETLIPGKKYFIVCYPEDYYEGYTLIFTKQDGTQAIKRGGKPVSIKRATFGVLKDIDQDLVFEDIASQQERERNALLAIYNAGGGEN